MAYIANINDVSKELYKLNRNYENEQTWRNLYKDVSLNEQMAASQLTYDYGRAVNDAYISAMANQAAISGSALGEGYKNALLADTSSALEEAFNSYYANYQSGLQTIATDTAKANQAITDELTLQAENTVKFSDAPYEYLQALFNRYNDGEVLDSEGNAINIFDDTNKYGEQNWIKYVNRDAETGELILKSKDELFYPKYELIDDGKGGQYREYSSFRDESGNLTLAGMDFYDQMLNEFGATREGLSFSDWLYENDKDLYDWAAGYNPYNYTESGTNIGTMKTMFGLASTDETYRFLERFGGWSESKIKSKFAEFENRVTELSNKYSSNGKFKGREAKGYITDVESLTDDLIKVAKEFGLDTSVIDISSINSQISTALSESKSKGELDADFWSNLGIGAGAGASLGTGIGAKAGTVAGAFVGLPSVGTAVGSGLGAIIGGAIGSIVGLITSSVSSGENEKANREYMSQVKNVYLNTVNQLLQYSLAERQRQLFSKK
jgi:hypothetical protein